MKTGEISVQNTGNLFDSICTPNLVPTYLAKDKNGKKVRFERE